MAFLDQFSQNFEDSARIQAELTQRDIGIVAVREQIDTREGSVPAKFFRQSMLGGALRKGRTPPLHRPQSPRRIERATVSVGSMNDQQLDRNLRSIGREAFVTYFKEFCDRSRSNEDIAAQIEEERGYTAKSCRSRTSHARSIIGAGRAMDALIMVSRSTSPSVPGHIKEKAAELVRELESNLL